jgi:hypothetical protein
MACTAAWPRPKKINGKPNPKMGKSKLPNAFSTVDELIAQLEESTAAIVRSLRATLMALAPEVQEQIKWNSPSYSFTGELPPFNPKEYKRDIVVFNLHRRDGVLLVFPTGARIVDGSGLLTGNYADGRRLAHFPDLATAEARAADLQAVVRDWISRVAE